MFREYLVEDCGLGDRVDELYADPARLLPEWRAWLRQTQIENGFVTEEDAATWKPTEEAA